MKVGIFFGGRSREREVSFAGGRTIYDNLNKSLFEPIPIFVDSLGNFILLDWQYIYKGTIRDFYPPTKFYPADQQDHQLYIESLAPFKDGELEDIISSVGEKIEPEELPSLIDFAFLTLHGNYGEDGTIQGIFEWLEIPYSGSGILPSSIGIDKIAQKKLLTAGTIQNPYSVISENEWFLDQTSVLETLRTKFSEKVVIKSPRHGSSIGVSIIELSDEEALIEAIDRSFFRKTISRESWESLSETEKTESIQNLGDIRSGLGFPLHLEGSHVYSPLQLISCIESLFSAGKDQVVLQAEEKESNVLVEQFINGREFSCIVLRNSNGTPVALPPTEILKGGEVFDYRSKYLPGKSRKETPMRISETDLEKIRRSCEDLFEQMRADVYARIDGFFMDSGEVYLNDPNTTSGMMPSSFFFHQAAEIGLDPSQLITYIIQVSLQERIKSGAYSKKVEALESRLSKSIKELATATGKRKRVAVILGGYSSERHISVESGRNIYEKLASSKEFVPTPIFLTGSEGQYELFEIPINLLLKDNADDIAELVKGKKENEILGKIRKESSDITRIFSGGDLPQAKQIDLKDLKANFDQVFIALHGRPGEDGQLQSELEELNIPYNGSPSKSSETTINKYVSNEILASHGILVPRHVLVYKENWKRSPETELEKVLGALSFPLICKPADDGCSSAVKRINDEKEFIAFAEMTFRPDLDWPKEPTEILGLDPKEEFPFKQAFLVEELVEKKDAQRFLEITGGLLTTYDKNGSINFEIFDPSEALTIGEVLSLEEKFLAGEGQNITPARFSEDPTEDAQISEKVKEVLRQTAEILNVQGYARIDAFVRIYDSEKVEVIIIEVNSLPGMTPATCIFHQTALKGYKPIDFIAKILEFGEQRQEKTVKL